MKHLMLSLLFTISSLSLLAWKPMPLPFDSLDIGVDTITVKGEWSSTVASGDYAPFWFTATSYGVESYQPLSTYLRASLYKNDTRPNRWWDYSYGADVMGGVDSDEWRAQLVALYAHVRLLIFDVTVGVKPEIYGNQDAELSSGGMLYSMNAAAIPRVSVGVDNYTSVPFSYGYLEFKGAVTHGWFMNEIGTQNTLLHYKYIAGRAGGKLPINISYEFHHAAQWGGTSALYGDLGASFSDFYNVFTASSGGSLSTDQINAYGNHIGMQALGLDAKGDGWKVSAYWQSIFEDGPIRPIWNTMNVSDGLWGLLAHQSHWKFISGLVYEFISTTDQSGPTHDIDGLVFGGNDSYFRNSVYPQGWNVAYRTIGTPFITSPYYSSALSTTNNRVFAHHLALTGDIYGYKYLARVSYADNYGTYSNYLYSSNLGLFLSVERRVEQAWNLDFKVAIGADFGSQFGNSVGAMVSVSKSLDIVQ
ncbi:MAG: capsule assembly Wzi family protein [bacterium]